MSASVGPLAPACAPLKAQTLCLHAQTAPAWLPYLFLSFLFVLAQSVPDPSDPVAEAYLLPGTLGGCQSFSLFGLAVWAGAAER